jgi:hypothetical protein
VLVDGHSGKRMVTEDFAPTTWAQKLEVWFAQLNANGCINLARDISQESRPSRIASTTSGLTASFEVYGCRRRN